MAGSEEVPVGDRKPDGADRDEKRGDLIADLTLGAGEVETEVSPEKPLDPSSFEVEITDAAPGAPPPLPPPTDASSAPDVPAGETPPMFALQGSIPTQIIRADKVLARAREFKQLEKKLYATNLIERDAQAEAARKAAAKAARNKLIKNIVTGLLAVAGVVALYVIFDAKRDEITGLFAGDDGVIEEPIGGGGDDLTEAITEEIPEEVVEAPVVAKKEDPPPPAPPQPTPPPEPVVAKEELPPPVTPPPVTPPPVVAKEEPPPPPVTPPPPPVTPPPKETTPPTQVAMPAKPVEPPPPPKAPLPEQAKREEPPPPAPKSAAFEMLTKGKAPPSPPAKATKTAPRKASPKETKAPPAQPPPAKQNEPAIPPQQLPPTQPTAPVELAKPPETAPAQPPQPKAPAADAPGYLAISCPVSGVTIEILDVKVGRTPLPKLELDPGRYTVWASKTGYEMFQQDVVVNPGKVTNLAIKLVEIPPMDKKKP